MNSLARVKKNENNRLVPSQEGTKSLHHCSICGKLIQDLDCALTGGEERPAPVHFDCVLQNLQAEEKLENGERIVYLGAGSFAIIEFKDKSESDFIIKRKILWERTDVKNEWRRALSTSIQNLM